MEQKGVNILILGIISVIAIFALVLLFKTAMTGAAVKQELPFLYMYDIQPHTQPGIQPQDSRTIQAVAVSEEAGIVKIDDHQKYNDWPGDLYSPNWPNVIPRGR